MRAATLLLTVVATQGCVMQGTYDTLKGEKDALEVTLAEKTKALGEAQKKLATVEAALADQQEKVKDLDARLNRAHEEMAAVTKDKSRLQGSVEEMTRALAELEKRRSEAESRVNEFKNLLSRFRALIDAGKLKVRMADGRMVVVLATDILFGSGSAALSKDGKAAVGEVARVLAEIPKRSFQIEGHTDNVPIASAQYPSNWELASARAVNVLKAMVDAGLASSRISAASFGDSHPVAPNDSPETKAQNRRIEIIIVPDLSGLPGFDELQKLDRG